MMIVKPTYLWGPFVNMTDCMTDVTNSVIWPEVIKYISQLIITWPTPHNGAPVAVILQYISLDNNN